MPQTPFIVNGSVTNSANLVVDGATVKFSLSGGSDIVITNSNGDYVIDLANLGYSSGETVSFVAQDPFKNEIFNGTFVISGGRKVLNISLSSRSDRIIPSGNRDFMPTNIGVEPVSTDNPLPVVVTDSADNLDLVNNPAQEFDYDGRNRVVTERRIIKGITYSRTFSYTGTTFNMIRRSQWERV